jgi:hypothetical protein
MRILAFAFAISLFSAESRAVDSTNVGVSGAGATSFSWWYSETNSVVKLHACYLTNDAGHSSGCATYDLAVADPHVAVMGVGGVTNTASHAWLRAEVRSGTTITEYIYGCQYVANAANQIYCKQVSP